MASTEENINSFYELPEAKTSFLEKFGLFYLNFFNRLDSDHSVFDFTDEQLTRRVKAITRKGIILSSVIGMVCVFPTIWIDIYLAEKTILFHYGWLAVVTGVSIIIELYLLFLLSLRAVYEVSELINMHASEKELAQDGVFGVKNILARTALELPDPELKILGIDPFKRISKKNLLILGLLYKAKIFVTNLVVKNSLLIAFGKKLGGISILYSAIPVECFWNSVVIRRVVLEARLRLFGFALANQIAKNVTADKMIDQLSPAAKQGCLRAIGNAVVMTQNYHPNMILLLLHFQKVLQITTENKYDDWNLFVQTLQEVKAKERFFLLDLFTVAAAFDGKLSTLEQENLKAAYGAEYHLYYPRLTQLTTCLKNGRLNAALALCKLDLVAG